MIAGQHLLGMRGMDAATIYGILATAKGFKEISRRKIKKVPSLRGRTILNVFYENSTRTRVSFELAAKRLSADTVNFTASFSSLSKGEPIEFTLGVGEVIPGWDEGIKLLNNQRIIDAINILQNEITVGDDSKIFPAIMGEEVIENNPNSKNNIILVCEIILSSYLILFIVILK